MVGLERRMISKAGLLFAGLAARNAYACELASNRAPHMEPFGQPPCALALQISTLR